MPPIVKPLGVEVTFSPRSPESSMSNVSNLHRNDSAPTQMVLLRFDYRPTGHQMPINVSETVFGTTLETVKYKSSSVRSEIQPHQYYSDLEPDEFGPGPRHRCFSTEVRPRLAAVRLILKRLFVPLRSKMSLTCICY
ncbi:hypothetical protein M378DRAFT_200677 [Amanita muscaria Koide BX008]|uniref:Uncharacterized protein n=1 Tax=Amanita muscaria (strain Koide BX008) TaxID=946122 RepID=A0A0C2S596_AMAMK|nr:hypothetical protein M378DRAFT_200677 [Amanita muscaria Koide BX008]